MVFRKRAKGKRLAPNKADTSIEKENSNDGTLPSYMRQLLITRQLARKIISYLNGNAAGITIAVSGFLAISTFIMKFFSYCYDRGKVSYWSIDTSAIQIFNNNILLEILFGSIFVAFFLFISGVFFAILPFKPYLSFSSLIPTVILYVISVFLYIIFFSIEFRLQVLLLPAPNLILAISLRFLIAATKPSPRSSSQVFGVIILFLMLVASTHYFYQSGLDSAKSQRTFPLLNDTQVVVYSTSTTYHTARYTIDGDTIIIDTSKQGTYTRVDGELELHTFETVKIQN